MLVRFGQSHIKGTERVLLTLVESRSGPLIGLGTASCTEVFEATALLFSLLSGIDVK